jgi:hypothetical protein
MGQIFNKLLFSETGHLGDNLVYSGIVNYYADQCDELYMGVTTGHYKTLTSLYKDHPRIKLIKIEDNIIEKFNEEFSKENHVSIIQLPDNAPLRFVNDTWVPIYWPLHCYDFYGLPFGLRYSNFRVPQYVEGENELYEQLTKGEPYVLVHRRPFSGTFPDGYPIDIDSFRKSVNLPDYQIIEIKPRITEDLMQYVKLIRNAEEIHCVDSSVFQLVDGMTKHTKAKLYFHEIRAFSMLRVNCKWNDYRWQIINYGIKL